MENGPGMAIQVRVNRALWLYGMLVILVTGLSWAIYLHHPDPYIRPLFWAQDRYSDLQGYVWKTAHLRGGAARLGFGPPTYNYPAPAAYVFKTLLYSFPGHEVRFYLSFLTVCVTAFGYVAWRAVRGAAVRQNATAAIVITALLGYPLWFTADRGNTEGVVWVVAAAGLCFLLRGRYRTAGVLIGLAASIKPFVILFMLLLLWRRQWKAIVLGCVVAAVAVITALTAMGPTPWKAYDDLKPGLTRYMGIYVVNLLPVGESRFGHSLLDGAKSLAVIVQMGGIHPHGAIDRVQALRSEPGGWPVVHDLVKVYPFVVAVGFALIILVFRKMPVLNQLTALAAAVTLFPPVAADYTLLHLYVPLGALVVFMAREVAAGKAELSYGTMLGLAVIYALLLSPSSLLGIYSGDGKLLLLLALLVVVARSPMRSAYFGDEPTEVMA